MGNVMLIPARRQVGNNARKQEEEKPKLRVAAYCRVSTDSDEQATSYEAQVEHYTEYIGDALLQETYTTDFLNKTRVKNNGIVPQYYMEGNHKAIIPKDIFLRVQEELVRRRVVKTSANGKKRSYSCNHCFAQIVICGECGEMFRRIHWNNRGCKSIVWRCISRLEPTG